MLPLLALLPLAQIFDAPALRGAHVTAYVIAAQSGQVLYARDPDDAMMPASTFKLLVGSAALDDLGTTFAFTTTLATDGSTLYVRGDGDPLLKSDDFNNAASALAAAKATQFDGLVADLSAVPVPYPDGWAIDDLPYDYAAAPSALSIDGNTIAIKVVPGAVGAPPALSGSGQQDTASIVNEATTGPAHSKDTLTLSLAFDSPDTLILTGSVPVDETDAEVDAAVLDPARAALASLSTALFAGNISIANAAPRYATTPANARVLWTHRSEALPQLLRDMWVPSDNLIAESLLDAFAPTRDAAIARERRWLQSIGVDPHTVTIADGSGLSAYDRISARDEVAILAHDWHGPDGQTVIGALPIAGERGTLSDAFATPPLRDNVIAKTGTVNHTRTLAGYLMTPHGTLIFALMINGWMDDGPNSDADLRAFQTTFLEPFFR